MIVAAAAVAGWAVTTLALLRLVASQSRAHARREDLLLNQLLHATGKPWQPAPADHTEPTPAPVERTWTWSPEQNPLDS